MTLDALMEATSRRVANSVTRRSFFGRTAAAVAVAGAGDLAFDAPSALAASCCGCRTCGHSTTCKNAGNFCPSGTCNSGSWYICNVAACGHRYTQAFTDCAGACGGGCYCGSDGRPGCFYQPPYGTCGGHSHVYCRKIHCIGPATC